MIWTPPHDDVPPVRVTVPTQDALLADLRQRLHAKVGFAIATINLDHVVKLRRDTAFQHAYAGQTHVTADGRPILWLSWLAGDPVGLVTGSDLVDPVVALCAELSAPIALFGSTQAVLDKASRTLQDRYPGLNVSATLAPPMGFEADSAAADALLDILAASGARVCLLALGAPKQEIFAARGLAAHPEMGFLSIGAGLDFIAGTQTRAPKLARVLALEWLWRLIRSPRRLAARYGACIAILPSLVTRAVQTSRLPLKDDSRRSSSS
jgi:N-acetylglucosaminyldiphosphoundecaprenol N-acetyl-beta-D-mannosaminyltransferase